MSDNNSLEFGPISTRTASDEVTSVMTTLNLSLWRLSQLKSLTRVAAGTTNKKQFHFKRVTVRSLSIPPFEFSIWVYIIFPISISTLFPHILWQNERASIPSTLIFPKLLISSSPTLLRIAKCSCLWFSNQFCFFQS